MADNQLRRRERPAAVGNPTSRVRLAADPTAGEKTRAPSKHPRFGSWPPSLNRCLCQRNTRNFRDQARMFQGQVVRGTVPVSLVKNTILGWREDRAIGGLAQSPCRRWALPLMGLASLIVPKGRAWSHAGLNGRSRILKQNRLGCYGLGTRHSGPRTSIQKLKGTAVSRDTA